MRRTASLIALVLCGGFAAADTPAKVKVAVFAGQGAAKTRGPVCDGIDKVPGYETTLVTADDIRAGKLKDFQVLVQPGGSGSAQAKDLGDDGRAKVKEYVKSGHGYIGICAGAYLASRSYDWSLHILDAEVVDRAHWARGTGTVAVKFSRTGKDFFGVTADTADLYYGQGPLLAPGKDAGIPDYEELAAYETEIHSKGGAQPGVMKGTTAAARGTFGCGRVFCFSPHPEKTKSDQAQAMLKAAVEWAAAT